MNISDVAKITGLTSKAIRFYEEKGLVTPPMRSENGYRTYTQQHLNELTLLRQARQVGFNLEESGELVNLFNDPQRHSACATAVSAYFSNSNADTSLSKTSASEI